MIPNPDTRSLQPSAGILDGTTWACRPALGEQETAPPTTATRPLEIRAAPESPLMAAPWYGRSEGRLHGASEDDVEARGDQGVEGAQ